MQILLAAATEYEIEPFMREHPSADILITGIGVPSTIYHLTRRIHLIDYDIVIQAGIAGTFLPEFELGKVVLVHADTFADIGVKSLDIFSTIFETGLADADHLPYTEGWLINLSPLFESNSYEKVKSITVNMITDNKDDIALMSLKYNAVLETMEGAALHYVCLQEEVPFMQIRAVSNYIGERDKRKWAMKKAIENLNKELLIMYDRLLHENVKFENKKM